MSPLKYEQIIQAEVLKIQNLTSTQVNLGRSSQLCFVSSFNIFFIWQHIAIICFEYRCDIMFCRWGQVFILDALSKYKAADARDAENIVERVTPRLQHANCAVVLSAVKVNLSVLLFFFSCTNYFHRFPSYPSPKFLEGLKGRRQTGETGSYTSGFHV